MKDQNHIRNLVDQTMDSLDGAERAAANPYLFTRIKASLERDDRNVWSRAASFISRPAVAFSTIIIALFVNAILFFEFRSQQPSSFSREGEQIFANEYNLSDNTIYDSTIEPE